ncbi:MAG: hypothetical protein ACRCS8_02695 [Brevinema sp.]
MTFSSKKTPYIFPTIVVAIAALMPFFVNFKYNDHSKNWLNHDYGKNLLSSTEEYSVFMTEGGDNQVFSSLYFTYAEKLRQDVFPYDQKGNIYKKIYGDLRYVTYETLEERRPIVDRGLFTGQEPFYENIRSASSPYLVPYAMGRPATYLTWKLENPQNLGDFYYKNYGQMYKVQHIKFAILDYLEFVRTDSVANIQNHIANTLKTNPNTNQWKNKWNSWLTELSKDGYIRIMNNQISLIKSYPKPFREDPKKSFLKRWDDIPNLKYYDYLSREIVNSFAFEQISLIGDEVDRLKEQEKSDPQSQARVKKCVENKWQEIEYYISLIEKSGYDSVAILHNLGIFYMSAQERFDLPKSYLSEAVQTWEKVVENFIYSWSTYDILFWGYLKLMLQDPQNINLYQEKFDHYYKQLSKATKHWKSMKDFQKSRPYQSTIRLVEFRKGINSIAGPGFEELKKNAQQQIVSSDPQTKIIIQYLSTMMNRLSLDQNETEMRTLYADWTMAWSRLKRDPEFVAWHVQMLFEITNGFGANRMLETLVRETMTSGAGLISLLPDIQTKFNTGFYLVGITKQLGLKSYETQFSSIVLEIGRQNLSAEQFEQLKNQLAQ